jgi:L-lactate utilization protein LutC|tara:strand:+ start:818 stop:1396 length:579 start_codon:yes stop_codon:yes gene_type:complete
MNFLKKLLYRQSFEDEQTINKEVSLSLDDLFVHNFLSKGGKFLYCSNTEEVISNLKSILVENNWEQLRLLDPSLLKYLDKKTKTSETDQALPVFTSCEHLIADKGDILFSSNQLKSKKITEFSENFIIYASTSQIVNDTGQGLTGIKTSSKKNLPTNISAIKNYTLKKSDDNFLNYGNSNSKNLYLLLFEDL